MQYLIAIACLALLTLTGCVAEGQRPINFSELGYVLQSTAAGIRTGQRQQLTTCIPLANGAFQCQTQ